MEKKEFDEKTTDTSVTFCRQFETLKFERPLIAADVARIVHTVSSLQLYIVFSWQRHHFDSESRCHYRIIVIRSA